MASRDHAEITLPIWNPPQLGGWDRAELLARMRHPPHLQPPMRMLDRDVAEFKTLRDVPSSTPTTRTTTRVTGRHPVVALYKPLVSVTTRIITTLGTLLPPITLVGREIILVGREIIMME
jgi:hypothetical protein